MPNKCELCDKVALYYEDHHYACKEHVAHLKRMCFKTSVMRDARYASIGNDVITKNTHEMRLIRQRQNSKRRK